jgi:autoinducer 2 (AI-2) kinase
LSRLYARAKGAVGDLGDLRPAVPPQAAPSAARAETATPIASGGGDPLREELATVVNELYALQLITATGGNVSARIGDSGDIWITPGQLFKGKLTPDMLVRIDQHGVPQGDGLSPSSERLMHCAVYRARADAKAVVHAHAAHATILANTGLPFLPISTEAAFFGNIPRLGFIMPGTEELARAVAAALRQSDWAVLMQNHGLLVAGRSLRRAADTVEIIERTSEVLLGCRAVGVEPPVLPADTVAELRALGEFIA